MSSGDFGVACPPTGGYDPVRGARGQVSKASEELAVEQLELL
jgi:hypothetical protein